MMKNANGPSTGGPAINYKGRFLYLHALQEHWPELLTSLANECLSMMIAAFKTNAARARPTTARELRSDPANQDLHQRIEAWASSRGIRDEWLMDAAVQTLASLARGSEAGRWVYIAPELPLPRFEPRFEAVWIPAAKWNDFRKHLVRQFEASLKEYRKAIAAIWGENSRSEQTHALWTVWFQQGYSPDKIRLRSQQRLHLRVALPSIQMAVREFARSIGLTLRARSKPRRAV